MPNLNPTRKTKKIRMRGDIWQDFAELKKLWPYLRKHQKYVWIAAILVPVISVVEMSIPLVVKRAVDDGVSKRDVGALYYYVSIYLGLVLGQYVFKLTHSLSATKAVFQMILNLRSELIRHILRLPSSFHDRTMSGALVTRATSDFDNLTESLNSGILTTIVDFSVLAGSIFGLFYLDWRLALAALIVLPIVYFIVSKFSKALKKSMLLARSRLSDLNAYTQECLTGRTTLKLLNAEKSTQKKHDELAEGFRKAQMSSVFLDSGMYSIVDGLTSITLGVVLFTAVKIALDVDASLISAGLIIAFVQYIQQMFEPIKQLSNKIAMLQGAFTAIDRIFAVFDEEATKPGRDVPALEGRVEFDDVSFFYSATEDKQVVLSHLTFQVQPGTSVALVGPTGSGKSTIIKLLTKLYTGYSGTIRIDGHDIRELDESQLRQRIAIVPQDVALFEGSVRFNISLGREGVTEEDIQRAVRSVGADKIINSLPGGLDFQVQEQGKNLSAGMRQLFSFSRALATNPSLVILDEATASIDPESEDLVQKGIESLLAGHSVIVIAHRLSTIRHCEKILVLSNGELIEEGSHQALMNHRGRYFDLHQALV